MRQQEPDTRARPIPVGEDNPYGSDPRYALFCEPPNSAGGRLQRLVLDVSRREYLASFERVNLCARKWGLREARASAADLRRGERGVFVLLGAKVCSAFGFEFNPTFRYFDDFSMSTSHQNYQRFVVLPHPSGLSRAWNAPGAFDSARATLRAAGVLPVPPLVSKQPTETREELRAMAGNCDCSHMPCKHDLAAREA